jgi:IMP dehydrogenase
MQSVSDDKMAVALAKEGGISFIFGSQSIESQARMVARVKNYRAGFVVSDSNISPEGSLKDILALKDRTGHSTVAVTADGSATGKLVGIVTSRDYRISRMSLDTRVKDFMTQFTDLICDEDGITLSEANDIIWDHKLNCLPVIDKEQRLVSLVFRKDYNSHKENGNELIDSSKRYVVGAGINTRDYQQRIPALLEAGADVFCIDSSDGFTEWQKIVIEFVRKNYEDRVKIGAGNVVDGEGFRFLADAGADFIKVGIGGGPFVSRANKKESAAVRLPL